MITFTVVTIFPRMFDSPLSYSILKKAQEKNLISIRLVDPRDYATDRHRMTDDYPYGGGQGMVMKVATAPAGAGLFYFRPRDKFSTRKTRRAWPWKSTSSWFAVATRA
jgi:tRNA (guanine37-N1)-methyltransferase